MLEKELEIAQKAVLEAMRLSKKVQQELTGAETITKSDKSPVTIADYAAQAIVCRILHQHFPKIPIVGEERAEALRKPENSEIRDKIIHYITSDPTINKIIDKNNLFESIDLGTADSNPDIFWTLDPVDGTKGFLRGEQYAVALALIINGEAKLGVLGCPNLTLPQKGPETGYLLYAVRNQGAFRRTITGQKEEKLQVSNITDTKDMRFVESYESGHSNQDMQLEIAKALKMDREPVRMDSQVKYAVVASGGAEIYLRIPNPKSPNYKEKIWDHAAGSIIVEEAGGIVTDINGKKLDFTLGKTLKENKGIFGSVTPVHDHIVELIKKLSN